MEKQNILVVGRLDPSIYVTRNLRNVRDPIKTNTNANSSPTTGKCPAYIPLHST